MNIAELEVIRKLLKLDEHTSMGQPWEVREIKALDTMNE